MKLLEDSYGIDYPADKELVEEARQLYSFKEKPVAGGTFLLVGHGDYENLYGLGCLAVGPEDRLLIDETSAALLEGDKESALITPETMVFDYPEDGFYQEAMQSKYWNRQAILLYVQC